MTATMERKRKPKAAPPITEPKMVCGERVRLHLKQLERHPDNRQPTAASIEALAASLAAEGQIEPVLVRKLRGADEYCSVPAYQVVSGETRTLAARRLNWDSIECEIVQLDDAATLRILAAANAARQDLDPIAQARLIVRLCDPVEKGGSGMLRAEAAAMFDLQSGGAASNLVRLLDLPAKWQELVAGGELPQSYARELLPLLQLGEDSPAWGDAFVEWDKREDASGWDTPAFASRIGLSSFVAEAMQEHSRPIEKGDLGNFRVEKNWIQSHPLRFKLTPSLEKELRIVELSINGKTLRRATNCPLYDSLQIPAIQAYNAKRNGKARAALDDDEDATPAKALTPKQQAAEDVARREKAAEVLAKRIEKWRAAWLRTLVAEAIDDRLAIDICLWQQSQVAKISYGDRDNLDLEKVLPWRAVVVRGKMPLPIDVVKHWLQAPVRDGYEHPMPDDHVEDLVELLKIDLAGRWDLLQGDKSQRERFEEFFALHNSEQLDALGKELGVHVADATSKKTKVARFVGRERLLKLPRSLRSLRKRGG